MTVEEIKKEIERMQNIANNIKVSVGCLRSDINQLSGAIKQDNDDFEARLAEAESRGFQKGYEKGFAEGKLRKELSEKQDDIIRVGDVVHDSRNTELEVYVIKEYQDGMTFKGLAITDPYGFRKGDVLGVCWKPNYRKTGRHHDFDKILEFLKS